MAVDSVASNKTAELAKVTSKVGKGQIENEKGKLGKDQFLKLLLVELKHQDPTAPVETDKILSQTSQLASLEAATNTNKSLTDLATALSSSSQFTTIGAMGKIANLGNDEILLTENGVANFEMYIPSDVKKGSISIKDTLGNVVQTISISDVKKGVNNFSWNGENGEGNRAKDGSYHVTAEYTTPKGFSGETAVGVYPVSAIKFDEGKTMLKMGSQYVPYKLVKEIYEAEG